MSVDGGDGWVVSTRDGSAPVRVIVRETDNPLRDGVGVLEGVEEGVMVLCWSGSLGEDLFGRDWRTWGAEGMAELARFCGDAAAVLEARGGRLVLRPHARHVLSDPFKCRRFVDACEHARVGVALDAASMLEHSMLDEAEGHSERAFEMLGPVASLVVVTGVMRGGDEDAPPLRPPAGAGGALGEMIERLVEAYVPAGTPILRMICGDS